MYPLQTIQEISECCCGLLCTWHSPRVFDHPRHLLCRTMTRSNDQVSFVLSVLVIHHKQELSSSKRIQSVLHRVERETRPYRWSARNRVRWIRNDVLHRSIRGVELPHCARRRVVVQDAFMGECGEFGGGVRRGLGNRYWCHRKRVTLSMETQIWRTSVKEDGEKRQGAA